MKWFLKKTNTHIDTKIRHILKAEDLCWMDFPIPHYGVKGRQNYAFYLYTLKIFFHSRREIKERLNNHSAEVATETHPWTRNGIREERSGSRTDLNQRWVEMLTRKYRSRKYTFSAYSPPFRRCSRLKIFHLLNKSNLTRTSKSWFVSSHVFRLLWQHRTDACTLSWDLSHATYNKPNVTQPNWKRELVIRSPVTHMKL